MAQSLTVRSEVAMVMILLHFLLGVCQPADRTLGLTKQRRLGNLIFNGSLERKKIARVTRLRDSGESYESNDSSHVSSDSDHGDHSSSPPAPAPAPPSPAPAPPAPAPAPTSPSYSPSSPTSSASTGSPATQSNSPSPSTTSSSSSQTSSTPLQPKKVSADVLEFAVLMQIPPQNFGAAKRMSFKQAVALSTGTSVSDVNITSVRAMLARRSSTSSLVDFSIQFQNSSLQQEIATNFPLKKLNEELILQNLPSVSNPNSSSSPFTITTPILIGIIAGGVVLLGFMICVICMLSRKKVRKILIACKISSDYLRQRKSNDDVHISSNGHASCKIKMTLKHRLTLLQW